MKRRDFLMIAAGAAALLMLRSAPSGIAIAEGVNAEAILKDPDAPTAGNPNGDVTIFAFLDYNCPYCKKSAPDLDRIVKEDGKIKLVYKDWPILSDASVFGAQLALAAKYQGKYDLIHHTLMAIPGHRVPQEQMLVAIKASGIDMARLQSDLHGHADEITALLRRNLAQADALGLQSTPTYVIGKFIYSTLDYAGFRQAVARARQQVGAK